MPLAVAQYLRHLATRCTRMSRDSHDPLISKELEIISVELVERAAALEAEYTIPHSDDQHSTDIVPCDDDKD